MLLWWSCMTYIRTLRNLMHLMKIFEQGVALTGRNRTGPPCSVGHPTAQTPGGLSVRRQPYRRRQMTPTDASEQNSTGPSGGPVKLFYVWIITVLYLLIKTVFRCTCIISQCCNMRDEPHVQLWRGCEVIGRQCEVDFEYCKLYVVFLCVFHLLAVTFLSFKCNEESSFSGVFFCIECFDDNPQRRQETAFSTKKEPVTQVLCSTFIMRPLMTDSMQLLT